uniref:Acetylcholine receptor beta subunit n=1 Tax=Torpedo marmorata TaxID=7788 RepID=Q6S3I0_TORMA|nr:Chain B, ACETYLCHOLINE RECEPTOR BETA SUBUNIT [Torpedo marmorata]4AQ9_B Chain B, ACETYLCHOLINE RECEPTOR BETA SUBUNIT [Torpedo marmorata]4BOG_0 Chain 0, Acetylcholine receptor beta subunit [Torpedo marmorata]4BOG_B Chain B, Acetylcholine receptor beta subunit [Torpedo marmorata]4BOG_G Chain G, Acetylcholine receptor beta subunit [Torpedo marmorata]4BOG_L Chain L, Acetylcholine receptor beta subunit [Torpedo marmorata]4BOG_Q Chain Q, Acetylcholine receptor beta subunit [Torpedo marmorata]4BO
MEDVRRMALGLVVMMALALSGVGASVMEDTLLSVLFENYNPKVRPSQTVGDKVTVRVGLTLTSLLILNEKNEEMTTSVFLNLAWTDYRLQWDPAAYEGIKDLSIPSDDVWQPDIVLMNNNDGSFEITLHVNVLVQHTGAVSWHPSAIYRSSCTIKVMYFPFDWQNCTMVFKSYTYDTSEVILQHALDAKGEREVKEIMINQDAFTENGQWSIEHKPSRKNWRSDDPSYEDVTFYLIIQRKPLFYIVYTIVPCILISILAILVFYLPPDAGEKMSLSISALLALTVFLLLLADKVPETSLSVPIIISYLMFIMILVAFSVILSVVVLNLHHRSPNTHTMPNWIRQIFIETLPPFLWIQRPVTTPSPDSKPTIISRANDEYFIRKPAGDFVCPVDNARVAVQPERLFSEMKWHLNGLTQPVTLPQDLKEAVEAIKYIAEQLESASEFDDLKKDWQYVAMVADRLFLYIFITMCSIGTFSIFLDASHNVPPDNPFA